MPQEIERFLKDTAENYACVSFSHQEQARSLLAALQHGGYKMLHVIADFDMTLTKHWVPSHTGEPIRNLSSHAVLERGPAVSPAFAAHTEQLAKHYYPFEIDPTLDLRTKTTLMIEWWTAAHQAMIEEGITRSQITQQAESAHLTFRAGIVALLDTLDSLGVPLLVFSAGIADVIDALLRVNKLDRPNQAIISNHMMFQQSDAQKLVGFHEPLIHTFNKGESALHESPVLSREVRDALAQRKNVILLGDSLGDAHMANGFPHDHLLKIGFMNFGDEQRKREFQRAFDVVIEGDESLAWITSLIQFISDT